MSVYVGLFILPEKIDPLQWQKVYEESLVLLRSYPFVSQRKVQKSKFTIPVLSSEVEHDSQDPAQRNWSVCGDLKSKKTAGTFQVYADLNRYIPSGNKQEQEESEDEITDLVLKLEEYRNYSANKVFSSRTKGLPYHNYVLALAMLFESRLAPYALVDGNITLEQARQAKDWADSILAEPVQIPLLLDFDRLQQRLETSFQGVELVEAMYYRWLECNQDFFNRCLKKFGYDLSEKWFLSQIKECKIIKNVAAMERLVIWLNETGDLATLADLCCHVEEGPRFDPLQFCEAIAETWLTIPNEEYAFMEVLDLKPGQSETAHIKLAEFMIRASIPGRKMRCYIPLPETIQVLERAFPQQADQVASVVEKMHHQKLEYLRGQKQECQAPLNEFEETASRVRELGKVDELILNYDENFPQDEIFIQLLDAIGMFMKNAVEKFSTIEELMDAAREKGWRWVIYGAVEKEELCFTEEAWAWIDQETDDLVLQILLFSLALTKLPGFDGPMFFSIQALFENRKFAFKVKELVQSQQEAG